jgi:hypothetical protein
MRFSPLSLCAGVLISILAFASSARASFHLWQIVEVYSNASGTVQFIVMQTNTSGQTLLHSANADMISNGHTYFFDHDLSGDTTNKKMLLATPGYDALSGVPVADYHLGVNSFFNPAGDTLNFDGFNTLTFSAGQLPTNGTNALFRAFNQSNFTTGVNVATNFAGTTGTVQIPEPKTIGMVILLLLLTSARLSLSDRTRAAVSPCRRSSPDGSVRRCRRCA